MAAVRTFEVWSDLQCASGTRLAVIPDVLEASDIVTLEGADSLSLVIRFQSIAFTYLREGRVIRVAWNDGTIEEWRILKPQRESNEAGELRARIPCDPILNDLATRGELCKRTEVGGLTVHDFTLLGLTPSNLISNTIVPAAPAHIAAGTVDPTAAVDLTFDWDTPLSAVRELATLADAEVQVRRNGSTNYLLDLLTAIGSTQPVAYLLSGKNLKSLARETSGDGLITRIIPKGGGADGDVRTIARARWKVSAVSASTYIELVDPNGADGPAQLADQFNTAYARTTAGVLRAISDTVVISATTTRLLMANTTGFTVGDLIELRRNSSGDDITFLDDPGSQATYGVWARLLERDDIPSIRNLVANPQLTGVYTVGVPASWAKVGAPTCTEISTALYTRQGGKSMRVQTTADGLGVETAAVAVTPTADQPYLSAFLSLFVADLTGGAKLRVELYDVTNARIWPDPVVRKATTTEKGVWLDVFGPPNGYDAFAVSCASVKIRILQDGAGTTDFYLDAGQLTPTADLQDFFAGDGAVVLWQAGNDQLASNNAPKVSVSVAAFDLTRFDGTRFPTDALVPGGTVIVRHPVLGVDVTARIVRRERNLLVPMETQVQISNQPDGLVDNSTRPTRRPRRLRLAKEADPYRDQYATLGAVTTTITDTSIEVAVVPGSQVAFWRLHLTQAASLASADCNAGNLINERLNDASTPGYDRIVANGLLSGTQYAYRAIPYNRDGVRVAGSELTGAVSTTGAAGWMLSAFTVAGTGGSTTATNELRWSHSTSAKPGGYTLDIYVDPELDELDVVVTGRDPRTDAGGGDSIDASGDGGYDHTPLDVTSLVDRTWTYYLRLMNGATIVQELTATITRSFAIPP